MNHKECSLKVKGIVSDWFYYVERKFHYSGQSNISKILNQEIKSCDQCMDVISNLLHVTIFTSEQTDGNDTLNAMKTIQSELKKIDKIEQQLGFKLTIENALAVYIIESVNVDKVKDDSKEYTYDEFYKALRNTDIFHSFPTILNRLIRRTKKRNTITEYKSLNAYSYLLA